MRHEPAARAYTRSVRSFRAHSCRLPTSQRRRLGGLCWHEWAFLAGIVVIALLAASCAGGDGPREAPAATTGSPSTTVRPTSRAPAAPNQPVETEMASPAEIPKELRFEAPSLTGGTIRGADFAGQDLVIWFWAPW